MARKIYYGTNNTAKRIVKAYAEKNLRATAVKKIYVGVDNKAKQVFPGMYRWNKYSTKTVYVYKKYEIANKTEYELKKQTVNYYYTRYKDVSGSCAYENDVDILTDRGVFVINKRRPIPTINNSRIFFTNYEYTEMASQYDKLSKTYCEIGETATIYTTTLTNTANEYAVSIWKFDEKEVMDRGQYIQDVQSSYEQYPSDGPSGSYWYVFSHSAVVQDAKVGTVESDHEDAYPKNGVSGSYYYEFVGSI